MSSQLNQPEIQALADKLAFVDVETTGASPAHAAITEVAIVTVRWPWPQPGPPLVERWSSLVNPGQSIPPEIRFLTGIEPEMLVDAPSFAQIADEVERRLHDAVFIAHHARFDYGFIKAAMARVGKTFQRRTLCTVRLSRALHPERSSHTLDALIIDNQLRCPERHRAGGDALALWHFMLAMLHEHGAARVFDTARRLISRPNLPAHLNIKSLETLPAGAGIYFFHGLNEHPLYIGKSINLRQRVASHFCNDYQSARGIRLASETRRLSWLETPGEFSALLAEIQAIERFQPAHNRALRAQTDAWFVSFEPGQPVPVFSRLAELPAIGHTLGPFASRSAARNRLVALGREHGWCLATMKLERQQAGLPCFARQLGRCAGACVGAETPAALHTRIAADIADQLVPPWPAAKLLLVEEDPTRELFSWHLFEHWHLQQSGADQRSLSQAFAPDQAPPASAAARFNRHVHALLIRTLGRHPAQALHDSLQKTAAAVQKKATADMAVAADVDAALATATPLPHSPPLDTAKAWTTRKRGSSRLRWCWLAASARPAEAQTDAQAEVQAEVRAGAQTHAQADASNSAPAAAAAIDAASG